MPLVILDRDGVINEDSDDYIKTPEEWIPIPGSLEAIALLNRADYSVAIASNQSGIGRNIFSCESLDQINRKMTQALAQHGGHCGLAAGDPTLNKDRQWEVALSAHRQCSLSVSGRAWIGRKEVLKPGQGCPLDESGSTAVMRDTPG